MIPFAYVLLIVTIIVCYINKSKLLSLYFVLLFICDFSGWLKQQIFHYPKPYVGVGFILFAIGTCLLLLMPTLNLLFAIYSFGKRINFIPIAVWMTVSGFLLSIYPTVRGANMLAAFYAFYLSMGMATIGFFLSKVKNKFTFSQAGLFLSSFGSVVTTIIAIKEISVLNLDQWSLIALCNCIFYIGLIVFSIVNRVVGRLLP